MRVAFLTANEGVEQIELTEPWQAVEEADGTPRLVSTKPGRVQAFHHLDKGDTFPPIRSQNRAAWWRFTRST